MQIVLENASVNVEIAPGPEGGTIVLVFSEGPVRVPLAMPRLAAVKLAQAILNLPGPLTNASEPRAPEAA